MSLTIARSMQDRLRDRLAELRKMPLARIEDLPSYSDEEFTEGGKSFTLATWKNLRDDGIIAIVVQAYHTGFLYRVIGAGVMLADGFLVDKNGQFLPLPDAIRWQYC